MSRVAVKKEILQWALSRSQKTTQILLKKFPKINEWLNGEIQPTLRQLEDLAKATLTPLGFFFLEHPPEERLPIPHFRTIKDDELKAPSPNLLETIQVMQQRQAWMREYLIEEKQDVLQYIGSASLKHRPQTIAQKMRELLGFEKGWAAKQKTWSDALDTLRLCMEAAGILVVFNGIVGNNTHRKLDTAEFRGFVLVDKLAPLVFVNNSDFRVAQMFTLSHELAHLFYGSSAAFDLRRLQPADDPNEQACNRVAAEFLIPENDLREYWPTIRNLKDPFQAIARHFKVSNLVSARRALDLRLIGRDDFFEFYQQCHQKFLKAKKGKSGGGDFYNNQNLRIGQRFGLTVVRATKEGRLLYSEAFQLTGLYGITFDKYSSRLESGGLI